MSLPEDAILLYPSSLEEAIQVKDKHTDSFILSTFTSFIFNERSFPQGSFIINLSKADDLNFFVEDHGYWVFGASLPLEELAEICLERLPELSAILLQHTEPLKESAFDFLVRKQSRIHYYSSSGMQIKTLEKNDVNLFETSIICLISIPKKRNT